LIRVGVVGTGYMGENHVRIYSEMENVELIEIFDPNTSRVKELAARYNTLPFADHKNVQENGSSLFRVCNHHKNQYGLELKFTLPTDNDEEPRKQSLTQSVSQLLLPFIAQKNTVVKDNAGI